MPVTIHLLGGPLDGEQYILPDPWPVFHILEAPALPIVDGDVGDASVVETYERRYFRDSLRREGHFIYRWEELRRER